MKKTALAFFLIALVTACSNEPPPPQPLSLNYNGFSRINLAVRDVDVADRSLPQTTAPLPGGPYQPTLADAVRRWAHDRLDTTGASGQADVIIRDAGVSVQALPMQEGFDSWFTRQQGSKYVGHIAVEIEARGPPGYAVAHAEAHREISLSEEPSEDERQEAYNELVEGLMQDLNRNLERSIDEHMKNFTVTAPLLPRAAPAP